jgi:hypothetical protein
MKTTITAAAQIILDNVGDWDPAVLRDAAEHAVNGGSAWEFEGCPEDETEMQAFARAFRQIQA